MSATIILDQTNSAFIYGDGWTNAPYTPSYQGTTAWARDFPDRTLSFTFHGTSVSLVGNTPSQGVTLNASIDNGKMVSSPLAFQDRQIHTAWYSQNTLSDGEHTVRLQNLTGIALDFATITAGPSTPLMNAQLIVDETDDAIKYSGSWQSSSQIFIPESIAPSYPPYGGSTKQSTNAGDSFLFTFTGTSISVYGVFEWKLNGSTIVNYTVDEMASIPMTSASPGVPPDADQHAEQPNVLFFTSGNLPNGNHTLRIDVKQILGSQVYILDYLTYTAGFSSLAEMPQSPSKASSSSALPTPTSSSLTLTTSTSTSTNASDMKKHTNIVPIVVGTLCGVALCVALISIFICISRRRRKFSIAMLSKNDTHIDSFHVPSNISEHPFRSQKSQIALMSSRATSSTPTTSNFPADSPQAARLSRQETLRVQLRQMQQALGHNQASQTGSSEHDVAQLQHQIDLLIAENAQLQAYQLPPPAY